MALMLALARGRRTIVFPRDGYYNTRALAGMLAPHGAEPMAVDLLDLAAVGRAVGDGPAVLWAETPTNPLLRVADLARLGEIAAGNGAPFVVDNTVPTGLLQKPLELGALASMYSLTKSVSGHSDVLGGAIVTRDATLAAELLQWRTAGGGIPGPFESWLVLRGIKTLPLRMKAHEENGRAVAEYLSTQPKLTRLAYPGLKSHAQHEIAVKQQKGFGSMMSFDLKTSAAAGRFLGALKLFLNAESLGGVESLASHSATTTHAALSEEDRQRLGITEGLVRLSVGIEDKDDLVADLEQALGAV
jgi:cystathionine beta-lyase/cystathionine gamma-synthase